MFGAVHSCQRRFLCPSLVPGVRKGDGERSSLFRAWEMNEISTHFWRAPSPSWRSIAGYWTIASVVSQGFETMGLFSTMASGLNFDTDPGSAAMTRRRMRSLREEDRASLATLFRRVQRRGEYHAFARSLGKLIAGVGVGQLTGDGQRLSVRRAPGVAGL